MPNSVVYQPLVVQNVESQVIGSNPRRTRIGFMTGTNASMYVRPDPQGNVVGGIVIHLNSGMMTLTVEQHGDIVKGPWFAFSTNVSANFSLLETTD